MKIRFKRSLAILACLAVFLFLPRTSELCAAQASPAEVARQTQAARAQADAAKRTRRLMEHQFREVKDVSFPKTFNPVWYRKQKLDSSVKGVFFSEEYDASGDLLLEKDALTFKSQKETLRIAYAEKLRWERIEYPLRRLS
jgi:hypothetical protein